MKKMKIIAKRKIQTIEMPSGHFSRSEGPNEVSVKWEYDIPSGMVYSAEKQDKSENIPIVSEKGDVIGYAVTGWYACYGELYNGKALIPDEDYQGEKAFPYQIANKYAERQQQEMEEGCYGD